MTEQQDVTSGVRGSLPAGEHTVEEDRAAAREEERLSELRRAGYLTVAPPAAPPIGWSSHDPDID